jgi:hypothetical protein
MVIRMEVATTDEVPPLGVPAAPPEHAFHLYAYFHTSVESIHTSDLTSQSLSIRKYIWKSS